MTGTCIGTTTNTTDQNNASPNAPLCRASRRNANRMGDDFEAGSFISSLLSGRTGIRDGARSVPPLPSPPSRRSTRATARSLRRMEVRAPLTAQVLGIQERLSQKAPDALRQLRAGAHGRNHRNVRVVLAVLPHRQG